MWPGRRRQPERLTDSASLILLDEIAKRLADQSAVGIFDSKTFTVATDWYTIQSAWLAATIYNDGDSDIYVRLNDRSTAPWEEGEAPLKKGESIVINLVGKSYPGPAVEAEEGKPRFIPLEHGSPLMCFICKTGSAAVRVFRLA